MRVRLLFCTILLWLTNCIDPYDVGDVVDGQSRLVVDGVFTDQRKLHQIRLTYSSPNLQVYEDESVRGAEVFIEDEEGDRISLFEVEEGIYQTTDSVAGVVGSAYALHIRTTENKSYRSLPEVMRPVAEIDSIYAVLESRPYLSTIGVVLEDWGMQFYLSTGTGQPEPNFYRWEWEATYEFMAPLTVDGQINTPTCYDTYTQYRRLLIGTSQNLTQDRIERQPLTFVSKGERKLRTRFSILTTQYSLTERAFDFWSNVQEQQNSNGSVFDPPPAQIIGNMISADTPSETVLGYFQVSAVAEERFFISRGEVPNDPGGPVSGFADCKTDEPPDFCFDCTLIPGVTTERPPFW